MRIVSDLYRRLLEDPAHVMECRLRIAGTYYDESRLVSLSTTEGMFSEDTLSAGAAVAREIELSGFLEDDIPRMAELVPEIRLRLGEEASEWLQKGVFYIDTRSRDPVSGLTTIHGFDAMLMGEQQWLPDQNDEFPMTMADAVARLCAVMGVELDARTAIKTGSAYRVDYPLADNTTVRQVLRWIAGAHGGNWIMSDEGRLLLVPLNALEGQTGYLVENAGRPITFGGRRIIVGDFSEGGTARFGEKAFVGQAAAGVEMIPALKPVSRIILKTDDENAYQAGDDTGLTVEIDCAYGSQVIANDLLSQLGGYVYQPLQVEDGMLDPAAELGDGITVNRVYTVLARRTMQFDLQGASDFGAPGQSELESEYPFQSAEQQRFNYKLAQNYSLIEKTAEQIRMEVYQIQSEIEDDISAVVERQTTLEITAAGLQTQITENRQAADGQYSSLSNTITATASSLRVEIQAVQREVDGVESTLRTEISQTESEITAMVEAEVDGVDRRVSSLSLTVDGLTSTVSGVNGRVSTLEQTVDGIELSVDDLEGDMSQTVQIASDGVTITNASGSALTIDGGQINADSLNLRGRITFRDLTSDVQDRFGDGLTEEDVTTYIDEFLVSSPTIAGGEFTDIDQEVYMYLDYATSSGTGGLLIEDRRGRELFSVWGDQERMVLSSREEEFLQVDGGIFIYALNQWYFNDTVYFYGTVDFSNANVVWPE